MLIRKLPICFKAPFSHFCPERTAATGYSCFTTHSSNPCLVFSPYTPEITQGFQLCNHQVFFSSHLLTFLQHLMFLSKILSFFSWFWFLLIGSFFFCWAIFLPFKYMQELFHPCFPTVILSAMSHAVSCFRLGYGHNFN